jgi:hypothetical protein
LNRNQLDAWHWGCTQVIVKRDGHTLTLYGPLAETMDRRLAPSRLWRRYALHSVAAVVVLAVGVWLIGGLRERIYRVPLNQLTVAAVTRGPFEDYIAVRPRGIHTGQAFDIKLEVGRAATALMLPNGPFYQETGGNWIFVVAPDGRYATRRTVRLGRRNPEHVEVVDGLAPGEKVIVSGYEAFQKIDRVEFDKPDNGTH